MRDHARRPALRGPRPGAGLGRAILPRQDHHDHRRLLGRRRLRSLCPHHRAPHRQAPAGQSERGGEQHAGRRQQRRGRLHLQRRAQGRHRDRRTVHGGGGRAAVQRPHPRHPRHEQVPLHRQCQQGRLRLPGARRRAGEELRRGVREGVDRRRLGGRRLDPRFPGTAQEPAGRQVQDRGRLSRHAADQPGDGARRGAGRLRPELVERVGDLSVVVQGGQDQGAGAGGFAGLSGAQQAGPSPHPRFRQDRRAEADPRPDLQPDHLRAALCGRARRAQGARRRAARARSWRRCAIPS